jgi:ABC-2 type transport system ATP-binding protein
MRSKLALLLACCRGADLLILDEPTDGLDPAATEQVLGMLVRLAAEDGVTVFFSSHQLHEVERIADRIAIIHRGRVRLDGELDDVRARFRRVRLVLDDDAPADALADAPTVRTFARSGRVLSLLVDGDADEVIEHARLTTTLRSAEAQPVGLRELFLDLTGGRA